MSTWTPGNEQGRGMRGPFPASKVTKVQKTQSSQEDVDGSVVSHKLPSFPI